jgi:hypothetical protein
VHLFALLLAHQSAPSALIVEGVKAKYGHESARQTFRPVSSILLTFDSSNPANISFFAKSEPLSQLNNRIDDAQPFYEG